MRSHPSCMPGTNGRPGCRRCTKCCSPGSSASLRATRTEYVRSGRRELAGTRGDRDRGCDYIKVDTGAGGRDGPDRGGLCQAARLPHRYGKVVTQIRRLGEARARVVYRDRRTGAEGAIEADFVVVTLPLKVLGGVAPMFSPRHKTAIAEATYMPAAKVAFDARRRFWEEDEHIYGGISWRFAGHHPGPGSLDRHARTGRHPRRRLHLDGEHRRGLRQTVAGRAARAGAGAGEKPTTFRTDTRHGVSICWGKIPFSEGAWCERTPEARRSAYPVLLEPDGPLFLAGEHLSYLTGWQEGAVLFCYATIKLIGER